MNKPQKAQKAFKFLCLWCNRFVSSCFFRKILGQAELPSSDEEGWLRHQKNAAKPPFKGAARSVSPIGRNIKNGAVRSRILAAVEPPTPFLDVSPFRAHASPGP